MTTEEKAKAYNKAIQKAKDYYNEKTKINSEISKVLELIFPELKESEDERIRKALFKLALDTDNYKELKEKALAWLEKQGKQKPNNNIELKFKVGDYLVNDYCKGKVIALTDDAYLLDTKQGIPFSCEHKAHLWTIQDAKDGNILVNGSNIFIFHYIYDKRIMGYCHVNTDDGRFYDDTCKIECFGLIDDIVKPATEEQCDSLIKAMTEAGYVFDFDKREFKKIEHSNEESNKFEPFYSFKNDNEYMCESIINVLTNNTVLGSKGREIYSKYIEWLKSLRDIKILVEKGDEIKK